MKTSKGYITNGICFNAPPSFDPYELWTIENRREDKKKSEEL
jgi:hypothetical protein